MTVVKLVTADSLAQLVLRVLLVRRVNVARLVKPVLMALMVKRGLKGRWDQQVMLEVQDPKDRWVLSVQLDAMARKVMQDRLDQLELEVLWDLPDLQVHEEPLDRPVPLELVATRVLLAPLVHQVQLDLQDREDLLDLLDLLDRQVFQEFMDLLATLVNVERLENEVHLVNLVQLVFPVQLDPLETKDQLENQDLEVHGGLWGLLVNRARKEARAIRATEATRVHQDLKELLDQRDSVERADLLDRGARSVPRGIWASLVFRAALATEVIAEILVLGVLLVRLDLKVHEDQMDHKEKLEKRVTWV